jgi:hypothetical protein
MAVETCNQQRRAIQFYCIVHVGEQFAIIEYQNAGRSPYEQRWIYTGLHTVIGYIAAIFMIIRIDLFPVDHSSEDMLYANLLSNTGEAEKAATHSSCDEERLGTPREVKQKTPATARLDKSVSKYLGEGTTKCV